MCGALEACSRPPFQVVYAAAAGERLVTHTYCRQMSSSQYQRQKLCGSQLFLAQLLDQLVENTGKFSTKERKRKLKEVRGAGGVCVCVCVCGSMCLSRYVPGVTILNANESQVSW